MGFGQLGNWVIVTNGFHLMERFVVRQADAPAAADGSNAVPQRLRQTRIGDGAKVVVAEVVQVLKAEIDAARTTDNMMRVLEALEAQFISLEMLEQTLIGRSLQRLYQRAQSGACGCSIANMWLSSVSDGW